MIMDVQKVLNQTYLYQITVAWFYFLLYLFVYLVILYFYKNLGKSKSVLYPDFLICVFIILVALINRLFIADHSFFHDNNHGYPFLQKMLNIFKESSYRIEYGVGGFAFHSIFLKLFHGYEKTVFYTNSVFGALTCVLLYGVVYSNWGSRNFAFWSALTLAVLPAHIKISGTEILYITGAFWGLLSLFMASIIRNNHFNFDDFVLLPLSAAIAVQFRETLNLYFLVLIVYLLFFSKDKIKNISYFTLHFLFFSFPHNIFYLLYTTKQLSQNYGSLLFNFDNVIPCMFSKVNILFDISITPLILTIFFFIGLVKFVFKRDKAGIFIIGIILLFSSVAFMKTMSNSNRTMFHVHYQMYIAIVMAYGMITISDIFIKCSREKLLKYIYFGIIFIYLIFIPILYKSFIQYRNNIQIVYHFIIENLTRINPNCQIITLKKVDIKEKEPVIPFPYYYKRFLQKEPISINSFLNHSDEVLRKNKCVIYFESPVCHIPTIYLQGINLSTQEINNYLSIKRSTEKYNYRMFKKMRGICSALEKNFKLERINILTFNNVPDDISPIKPEKLRIGFYKVLNKK